MTNRLTDSRLVIIGGREKERGRCGGKQFDKLDFIKIKTFFKRQHKEILVLQKHYLELKASQRVEDKKIYIDIDIQI